MPERMIESPSRISPPPQRRTMLVPAAYSESAVPALRLARSSRLIRKMGIALFLLLVITMTVMAFAPWQQNVTGKGSVLAFAPDERQQVIEAPIKGRIENWSTEIYENVRVTEGQVIAEILDLDSDYKDQLARKLFISQQAEGSAISRLENYRGALVAAKKIVNSYEAKLQAYEHVKQETVSAQNAYVQMAEKKVNAEKEQLAEYRAAIPQLQSEYDRLAILYREDNVALQKFQEIERKLNEYKAKVSRAIAYFESAQSELEGKIFERAAKTQKAQADIEASKAELDKAIGDVAKTQGEIDKAEQDVNKTTTDIVDLEVSVARQNRGVIVAPFDGFIVKIKPNLKTAVLKEGDAICTIVPDTKDRSVEIFLSGNDAPLVGPGRHVRLQFEGWPALQFSGWPSVAVGTFPGEIVSVDATDNGKGKFRVLIRPEETGEPWPDDRYLRQGVRANAWVLLDRVPLWYEIWRQLNGFPPVVDEHQFQATEDKPKPPKLPK